MISATTPGTSQPLTSLPPVPEAPSRTSGLRAAAGAAARGLAELAVDTAAAQLAKTTKTSKSAGAKRTTASRTSSAGYAKKTTTSSKKPSSTDPLAFLRDPKLSIEDKLMLLLAHLNAKYEQEMQRRMDEIAQGTKAPAAAKSGSAASSSSAKKKKGGLFGAIASVVTKVVPGAGAVVDLLKDKTFLGALSKLGGPVLAAGASALGFPALAPALLKLGPTLAGGAGELAKAIDAELRTTQTSGSSGSSASRAAGSSGATASDLGSSESQVAFMQLQRLQDRQKEMFATVSAILRSQHESRMGIIGNIR